MIRVSTIVRAGNWTGPAADSITLDREDRHRRRAVLTAIGGLSFLLDQPKAVHLHHGDGLVLEDGRIVEVLAEPEDLIEIRAENAAHLVKIAWHLGNRHLPTQLMGDRLRIRRDHVIEDMVEKLGGTLTAVSAPFDPEGGAYGHGQTHGHSHGHGRGHAHPHD
ncbi:urease accessory protein UreE [Roseibium denhamense]|uniref:Urease accessory protein UreE n=1 Tax=Roseibium denhamense TaxID=76305 RepID=A0ABY1PER2_9HYPH|nr:urease accessory protein UreE [Roseibium denhamense]MTI05297.1 urease accessory protein UreE [Roseibium denhamense]SMP30484.1 urease accessory protein [Roseibium denhamense]